MEWFSAPDYWLARLVVSRGLGLIYLIAFLSAAWQFPALLGERGLTPVPRFLARLRFRDAPSLFHFHYSDRLLRVVVWSGVVLALTVVVGLAEAGPLWASMLVWFVLWGLYLSIVNVGQTWYSFGWESLLCEAGFLAIFLGSARTAPPLLTLWLFRWLAFRLEFGAALIKLRGDSCWRRLTCLDYHHETQPMPNPLSWYFHRLPAPVHRVEVVGNFVAQLAAPFGLFLPQPGAAIGAGMIILTQAYLVVSGNYSWLNWITIVIGFAALPDSVLGAVLTLDRPAGADTPLWFAGGVMALALLCVVLSYWPVRNLASRHQLMNYAFNRWHLINTYGAFGTVGRERYEVVLEGTADTRLGPDTQWREYEFKAKPGDTRRRPPQVAPYHLRLDWLMWFAAISPGYAEQWFLPLMTKLLEGDPRTLRLLRHNPFPTAPPRYIRARYYRYKFTTWKERRESKAWWIRLPAGEYLRAVGLEMGMATEAFGPRLP